MSRRRLRFRGCTERWVGLPHWMMKSAAYQSLPGDAIKLLLAVWQRHNGLNNGEITFACREAASLGLPRSTPQAGRQRLAHHRRAEWAGPPGEGNQRVHAMETANHQWFRLQSHRWDCKFKP